MTASCFKSGQNQPKKKPGRYERGFTLFISLISVFRSQSGLTRFYKRVRDSGYPNDIDLVKVEISFQHKHRIRVKVKKYIHYALFTVRLFACQKTGEIANSFGALLIIT